MIYHTGIACRTADGTHLSIVPLYVIYHIVQTAKAHSLIQALYHKQEQQTVKHRVHDQNQNQPNIKQEVKTMIDFAKELDKVNEQTNTQPEAQTDTQPEAQTETSKHQLTQVHVDTNIFKTVSEGEGDRVRYTTTFDDVALFNAVSGSSEAVKDYLDKEVEVSNIVVTSADVHEDVNDDDSPIVSKPCVHFYTPDGGHMTTLSNGIIKNVKDLIGCGFAPSPEHTIVIRFKTIQTKKGIAHTFDLVKRN